MITKDNLKDNFPTIADLFIYAAYFKYLKNIHYPTVETGGIKELVKEAFTLYFAEGITPKMEGEIINLIALLMEATPSDSEPWQIINKSLTGEGRLNGSNGH